MPKIKLIDVAQHAGVSKSTVSQYINGRFEYMSSDTKERIEAAIKALNYVPNPIARSLKTDKTKTIGVIVRDITGYYTSRAIRGIDDYCKANQYNVQIYNTDFDPEVEARSLQALHQLRIDGLIIASSGKNQGLISDYIRSGFPVVQFQLEHDDTDKNIILSDYKQAAFEATEYLIQQGHTKICFVTQEFEQVKSRSERYQGYADALTKHKIPIVKELIQYWKRESGLQNSIKNIMQSSAPTVFFTQHLAITTDVLTEFNQTNVSIPEDISLLGFDEVPMAEFFKVPITVVQQQPYEIGAQAAKMLLENIQDKQISTKTIMIPCSLVKRKSVKKL
ncbi:LacI family DNA-binding transcriptional regulator [Paraglaciecola sp.]|uniref:LacI family DNA-binding transcriptional regulator n=1 Tax=Paraglaciecola sp. TaxID=1920173 RepID=UPI003EF850DD